MSKLVELADALSPAERDLVVELGVAIEGLLPSVPPTAKDCLVQLHAVLHGLQTLFAGSAADPVAIVGVVQRAMQSAFEALPRMDDDEAEAKSCSAEFAMTGDESCIEPVTLNDAAALIMQLNPEDPDNWEPLAAMLAKLQFDANLSDETREAVCRAAQMMQDAAVSPAPSLEGVGSLLECAVNGGVMPEVISEEPLSVEFTPIPDDTDRDILAEFIMESMENIQNAEGALLTLEIDSTDNEAVNTVFRAFHTIKGTSAFLGLKPVSELAHRAESLLSQARDGELRLVGGYADLALRSIDMLKALVERLQDALGGEPFTKPEGFDELLIVLADPSRAGISDEVVVVTELRVGDILVAGGVVDRDEVEIAAASQGKGPIGEALLRSGAATLPDIARAIRTQRRSQGADVGDSTVRVRTDRLDRLIEMVGELVIAHSMISQDELVLNGASHELSKKVARAGKIVRELQDLSMSMRMVPLRAVFQKMTRLSRDVAHKSGKQASFITEGDDTEIDRNMVDLISDPLVHMVRNAIDHGLEPPEMREEIGKPASGNVRLAAYHAGGNVVIELHDDGRGLDREKIVAKAISHGLIESDKGMSDNDVFNLIFQPGFSTAEQVTDVSGRGVGLDVVKKNIDALRGRIDISSTYGKGCRFTLRLPLTLAVTDGMLVQVGGERYIIPTLSIQVTFRPDAGQLSTIAERGEMVMVRGELMPVLRLHQLFHVNDAVEVAHNGLLVVLDDGGAHYALLVDELLGQQQVVAKPLGDGVGRIAGVAGGAILGDGRVGLILDPRGLTTLSRHATCGSEREVDEACYVALSG